MGSPQYVRLERMRCAGYQDAKNPTKSIAQVAMDEEGDAADWCPPQADSRDYILRITKNG